MERADDYSEVDPFFDVILDMRIRSKVLLVVLPLLIFPAFLIGYTGLISAKNGITKVAKEFLSYKIAEMYKFCSRQEAG